MIELYKDKKYCCGCTACNSICPKNAITMKIDNEGFLYPFIDRNLCVECGLCKKVCPFKEKYNRVDNLVEPDAYGVKNIDDYIRMNSRSGGMFTAISDYVLDNYGVIYGVGYGDDFEVVHKRALSKSERDEFRGSKYVQSKLDDIFDQVKEDLNESRIVLFTGTPCQTSGLNNYLITAGVNKDNLILCDIICHGTPSPNVWKDYIDFMECKYKGKITNIDFRNKKDFGWDSHIETVKIKGKEYSDTIYTTLFYNHDILRPACFNCKYTNLNRPSDITLGDFWGIDDICIEFNDNKGVSLVLINTEKGRIIFEKIKHCLNYIDCTGKSFIHPNLKKPTDLPLTRNDFWQQYESYGFRYVIKKYGNYNFKARVKKTLKKVLSKSLKRGK